MMGWDGDGEGGCEERTGYGREEDGEDAEEDVACAAHFWCDDGRCFGLGWDFSEE